MTETVILASDEGNTGALAVRVGRLASLLLSHRFPAGDRATLKRMAPGRSPPLAFYRVWLRHMEEELPPPFQTSAWALLVWGLANSGPNAHRADRGFGHALAESRFSEHRLERLLAADHPTILTLAAAAVRFLATKGEAFDWVQLARLLLVRDDALLEATQRSIATDYYRHLPRIPDKE